MRQQVFNPYFAIILTPAAIFLILVFAGVDADPLSLVARLVAFGLYAYVGARYVGRAPVLIWRRDFSAPARNIVGWGVVILASMATMLYGWLYIAYSRPEWLSSMYWSPAFIVLLCVGLGFVASSIPKIGPFANGPNGLSVFGSFLVGFISAGAMFFAGHIPQLIQIVKAFFTGAFVHAF